MSPLPLSETRPAYPEPPKRPDSTPLPEPLSDRELQILHLVAAGLTNRQIAEQLILATGTVKKHLNNIYTKLDVESRTQALARARALGLV